MREAPVRAIEPWRLSTTPTRPGLVPDASLMQRRLLFTLLVAVMAGLAERLQVALIPEQPLITTMSLAMVTHQQGCVAFQLAASAAHIEIAEECAEPELLPSRGLVP